MDDQTLKQYLETREGELSESEFFALVFDALESSPSMEAREVLGVSKIGSKIAE